MSKRMENKFPKTITFNGENLLKMKAELDKNSPLAQNFKKKADELLGATLFLCDDRSASAITGVVLPIDCGFAAYSGV